MGLRKELRKVAARYAACAQKVQGALPPMDDGLVVAGGGQSGLQHASELALAGLDVGKPHFPRADFSQSLFGGLAVEEQVHFRPREVFLAHNQCDGRLLVWTWGLGLEECAPQCDTHGVSFLFSVTNLRTNKVFVNMPCNKKQASGLGGGRGSASGDQRGLGQLLAGSTMFMMSTRGRRRRSASA